MHIILNTEELKLNKNLLIKFPDGTTIIENECSKVYDDCGPINSYIIKNEILLHVKDFIEFRRNATEAELAESNNFTKKDVVKWWTEKGSNESKYYEYQMYSNAWNNYFNIIDHFGYHEETNQVSFNINPKAGSTSLNILSEIDDVIEFIKPVTCVINSSIYNDLPERGKCLGVIDNDLSESGIVNFWVFESCYAITKTTYNFTKLVKTFITLDDAVDYLMVNHKYDTNYNY
jgi:hypothetical protein